MSIEKPRIAIVHFGVIRRPIQDSRADRQPTVLLNCFSRAEIQHEWSAENRLLLS